MLYLCVLLFFVFFAGIAMTVGEGLWSNTINLLCILISIPTAIGFGMPLGVWGHEQAGSAGEFLWYFVFGCVWITFFVSMLILRILCDRSSRTRMRFVPLLDNIAGPLVGIAVAVMFTSFLSLTLLAIPIRAGEWKYSESADWQKNTTAYFAKPSALVLNTFEMSEDVAKAILDPKNS